MTDLRIGLIGYGGWTREAYVPALRRDGRSRIVSAAAASPATRQRIGVELGADVAVFDGPEALLTGPEIDAVMIAVPDPVHEQALGAALDAGVAIYYEPPVAETRRLIRPMLTRMLKAPQVTHADLEIGFMPVVVKAAERVRSGVLGRLQQASIRVESSWGAIADSDLCTINHLAPWYVDPLNRILDATPDRVLVLDGRGIPGRRQAHTFGHFDYDGIWGTFQANIDSLSTLETHIEINGDDGDMVVNIFTGEIRLRSRDTSDWSVEQVPALEPRAGWPGLHECVAAFLDTVTGGPPSSTDARVVAQLHLVGLAAEVSKDTGAWAEIEDVDTL